MGNILVLLFICNVGRPEAVALLLNAGANPHKAADRGVFLGKTPLMWASSQGRAAVVRILVSAGVDVNYSSNSGNFKVHSKLVLLRVKVLMYEVFVRTMHCLSYY
jgi:ankyrin repeat protein